MVKVICTNNYNDLVLNKYINKGEELEVELERAKVLVQHDVARIVQEEIEIPKGSKEIKVSSRPVRTTKRK